jgi:hypothetical protein
MVRRITEVEREVAEVSRSSLVSANRDLIRVLMEQPYARTRDVIASRGVSRPTATKWLKQLAADGVLQELRVGREVLYINLRMMEVLSLDPPTARVAAFGVGGVVGVALGVWEGCRSARLFHCRSLVARFLLESQVAVAGLVKTAS